MLELLLCSIVTVLPDYLYRRYAQGKRIGHEITLYSVWFELRWGITACAILTVSLITVIFYFHPSTINVMSFYRTVPVLPERAGRVAEIYVGLGERVEAGAPIFRLDDASQRAAAESARRRIAEVEAEMVVARSELAAAEGQLRQAESAFEQAEVELETRQELQRRDADTVAQREIDRLQVAADGRQGAVDAAIAARETVRISIETVLPAQKASAEAALAEAQVDLDKSVVRAGVTGTMEQFTLRIGDIVNPLMRPAGILVPEGAGTAALEAGFGQIEAQVLKAGMIAEVTCVSRPFKVIPMVVSQVQGQVAAGQLGPSDRLIDPAEAGPPGSITVLLEPLFAGGLDRVPPGSRCIANAYTSNHDRLEDEDLGPGERLFLHAVDTVGIVHAAILRFQALLLPVRALVLTGH